MNLLANMPIDTSPDLGVRPVELLVLALPIFAALMLAEVLVTSLQTVRPLWVKPPGRNPATKRKTSLMDISAAVTAFDAEKLPAQCVTTTSLRSSAPNRALTASALYKNSRRFFVPVVPK